MANAHIHYVIIACMWVAGNYATFRSTAQQYDMEVLLKPAETLSEAMSTNGEWILQPYRMPWTQILSYLWWGPEGYEACLYSADFKGERGINLIYRFLAQPTQWHQANIDVPGYDPKWSCMYLKQDLLSMLVGGHGICISPNFGWDEIHHTPNASARKHKKTYNPYVFFLEKIVNHILEIHAYGLCD